MIRNYQLYEGNSKKGKTQASKLWIVRQSLASNLKKISHLKWTYIEDNFQTHLLNGISRKNMKDRVKTKY